MRSDAIMHDGYAASCQAVAMLLHVVDTSIQSHKIWLHCLIICWRILTFPSVNGSDGSHPPVYGARWVVPADNDAIAGLCSHGVKRGGGSRRYSLLHYYVFVRRSALHHAAASSLAGDGRAGAVRRSSPFAVSCFRRGPSRSIGFVGGGSSSGSS